MDMKAFLMQNLSPVSLLVFEIYNRKISLGEREQAIKFGYLPPENGLSFQKLVFISTTVLLEPKLTPLPPPSLCQFQQFPSRGQFFHFVNFWDLLMRKEQQQPPRLINFAKIWSEHVLKINTESHNRHLSPSPPKT